MAANGIFAVSGQRIQLTTANNGGTAVFGNTSTENPFGTWTFQFIPDGSFAGGFAIMGRAARWPTTDAVVPWMPIPYRRVVLANVAQDYTIVIATLNGTPDIIAVPANGIAVGLQINCTAGTCWVHARWSPINSL
jgi:hypothetical protein